MNGSSGGTLQNVLSISTAANNRYLLHFNSLNSLTQWTAGIRLAMYEHATLLEAYTGSLVAGKGKVLNNIRTIMERTKFKTEDWARVRFGAGTPWKRCWCVISPPDEKDWAKAQKQLKKKSAYERKVIVPKGNIKFYETRRINKKTQPIATISDAYAAYAIYPQSMPLIDQSSLVKVEGLITIHSQPSQPEATTEGFIFVMPEVHPAVTGFEMMLRWLFPVFDTFALYGRPGKLVADPLDQRGLMFAFPRDRRRGYLDTLDVSGLIHTEGSQTWSERQWRQELKKLTSHRMNSAEPADEGSPSRSRRRNTISRTSLPSINNAGVRFDPEGGASSPASRGTSPSPNYDELNIGPPRRAQTAGNPNFSPGHNRSASDAMGYKPSRLSYEAHAHDFDEPPRVPVHGIPLAHRPPPLARVNSEPESPPPDSYEEVHAKAEIVPVTPVAQPPSFMHNPSSRPANQPYQAPELRRATSEMDMDTMQQMNEAMRSGESPIDEPHEPHMMHHNGSRQEVDIDATNISSQPADVLSRKGLVNPSSEESDRHPLPQPPVQLDALVMRTQSRSPPVPQHRQMPQMDGPADGAATVPLTVAALAERQVNRKPSSQSIKRKPIASRNVTPQHDSAFIPPSSPSSVGGFSDEIIDNEALERLLQQERASSITTDSSVDYASTTKSESPKKPVERPRIGRLKTVGDETITEEEIQSRRHSKFDVFHEGQEADRKGDLPTIDFGPTYTYKPTPTSRPVTSGTLSGMMGVEDAPESRSASRMSVSPANHSSYLGGRTTPSPGGMTPTDMLPLNQDKRRSMVWAPSGASPNEQNQSLTPEQWVQHRASIAAQPQPPTGASRTPMHVRKSSAGRLPSGGSTPPLSRSPSGDWAQQAQRTPPRAGSRPNSRGAGIYLNAQSPGGLVESGSSKHLTAQEQMQVARATGGPLVEVKKKDKTSIPSQNSGLFGALEAREREKAANKYGMQSGVVQQAITARQQQQYQAEMQAQLQAQHFLTQQAAQATQAAHAAQLAHFQALQAQQSQQGYAGPSNATIRNRSQSPFGFAQRPGVQSNRSSMYLDQYQQQGAGFGNPSPYQQSNRGSYYGFPNQQQR